MLVKLTHPMDELTFDHIKNSGINIERVTFVCHTDQNELASDNESSDSDENEAQKPAEGKKLPVFDHCRTICLLLA